MCVPGDSEPVWSTYVAGEVEDYSVAYFDHIAVFKASYR